MSVWSVDKGAQLTLYTQMSIHLHYALISRLKFNFLEMYLHKQYSCFSCTGGLRNLWPVCTQRCTWNFIEVGRQVSVSGEREEIGNAAFPFHWCRHRVSNLCAAYASHAPTQLAISVSLGPVCWPSDSGELVYRPRWRISYAREWIAPSGDISHLFLSGLRLQDFEELCCGQ